jgi:signal transduction histidine kinase
VRNLRSSPQQEAPRKFTAPSAPNPEIENDPARRIAIVGQLAGGILHDFNNALTVITGTIEILAEGVADRPQLAAIARLIDGAASRSARLATQLLAFARGQPSVREEVDVSALLAEAASLLRPTLGERIEVAFKPVDTLPPVLADPGQLLAAILSLGITIRDAMPEGGTLTLWAARSSGEMAGAVAIRAHAAGQAPADRHSAARPIELDFVEGLVRQSGGDLIPVRSNVGTSVEIVLPRARGHGR